MRLRRENRWTLQPKQWPWGMTMSIHCATLLHGNSSCWRVFLGSISKITTKSISILKSVSRPSPPLCSRLETRTSLWSQYSCIVQLLHNQEGDHLNSDRGEKAIRRLAGFWDLFVRFVASSIVSWFLIRPKRERRKKKKWSWACGPSIYLPTVLLLEIIVGPRDTQCWSLDQVLLGAVIYNMFNFARRAGKTIWIIANKNRDTSVCNG